MADNAIDSDVQKPRFALLLNAGYGERQASQTTLLAGVAIGTGAFTP